MTTGMSAPPIDSVSITPSTPATPTSTQKSSGVRRVEHQHARRARPTRSRDRPLSRSMPGKRSFLSSSMAADEQHRDHEDDRQAG